MERTLTVVAVAIALWLIAMLIYQYLTRGTREIMRRTAVDGLELGKVNTRAIEENTAALRELIARLDRRDGLQ